MTTSTLLLNVVGMALLTALLAAVMVFVPRLCDRIPTTDELSARAQQPITPRAAARPAQRPHPAQAGRFAAASE